MNLPFTYSMLIMAVFSMAVLLLCLRFVALKTGLVDVPNSRKIHQDSIPLVGGLALFLMAVVLLIFSNSVSLFSFYLILAAGLVVFVGLLDDLYQLSAMWRFGVQIMASFVVIYFADVQLTSFGYLLFSGWDMQLAVLSIPVTIFGVVGVINALNMADGIDGLAAMTFVSPVLALVFLSDQTALNVWLLLFVSCVFVFVLFNQSNRYKVFLGDSGSLLLGFILAWLLVYFSQGDSAIMKPVTALYLVALPVYDTIFVMLRRIFAGHSPFEPDNTHLHHLFLSHGFSQPIALILMMVFQILLIALGVGFLLAEISEYYQFYLFCIMSVVYYLVLQRLWERETEN